ncbi:ABC transporter permease [Acrocarpospora catenulata]|uniref:ABC transporter permease n=1 Tax=Acrocarpospora catenulata TaxID=2836182 RepID=UPI001BDAFC8B|nr:ABC transporter permease [Acrocarpospora catenulata]
MTTLQPTIPARSVRSRLGGLTRSTPAYITVALVALVVVFSLISPEWRFLDATNLQAIGRNSAGLVLLAVGLTFVLGAGHIDLSVGATLVLSSVVAGTVAVRLAGEPSAAGTFPNAGLALVIAALAAVVVGGVAGLINGVLVTRLKVNSFVVTLGTMGVATGAAQVLTNGANVAGIPPAVQTSFGLNTVAGIPLPLVLAVVISLLAGVVLTQTSAGRHALAIGSSADGARRAGVNVQRSTIVVFVISGLMAGLAGFLDISRFGTTAISGHSTTMLQALSAVIIGGTSLFGGRASVPGSVIATFIPTVLLAGFVMVGVSSFYQNIAIGVVLIIAVWLDQLRGK